MSANAPPKGYRGYVASRPISGSRTPQHVQNLVIRDYAARLGLDYRLSITEHSMENCYLQMGLWLKELPKLEGLIAYSLFMMPPGFAERDGVFRTVLQAEKSLHFAVEQTALRTDGDRERLNQIWRISQTMAGQDKVTLKSFLLDGAT